VRLAEIETQMTYHFSLTTIVDAVTEPITLYDHALFALYILNKDPSKDEKLKRPFPVDSPMAK